MMGPCLFALIIMIAAWVSTGSQAGPADLQPLWGTMVAEQTQAPASPRGLCLLETPRWREGRTRDPPSVPPVAEKLPGHRSRQAEPLPAAAALSQSSQLVAVPWAGPVAPLRGLGATAGWRLLHAREGPEQGGGWVSRGGAGTRSGCEAGTCSCLLPPPCASARLLNPAVRSLTPPGLPRSEAQALLPLLVEALGFLPPPRDHLGFHCHLSVCIHGNQ